MIKRATPPNTPNVIDGTSTVLETRCDWTDTVRLTVRLPAPVASERLWELEGRIKRVHRPQRAL